MIMRTKLSSRRLVLCAAALLSFALAVAAAPKKPAPAELNLTDLEGKKVHLKDYRGKLVVVNFWATWCVPCRDEMPMFVEVAKQWAPKGIVFIGASLDDKKTGKNIPEFVEKYKIDFPIWSGATSDDMDRLKMGNAVPDTAFLDEDGVIFARVEGEIRKSQLIERLEWLTGDRKGPPPDLLLRNLP
jgi:thiol-disulfide isomerase/thioredoxin